MAEKCPRLKYNLWIVTNLHRGFSWIPSVEKMGKICYNRTEI